ncbi:GCN5-related N-acetyltransferase [Rhodopseudomonas palustris BisB5]|uniref:GCN5-related N-acetyltransferase n=1 Tax=Rhodopseudomonas palustris (strain BisB5) TaxID=316057 RepID=Q135L3_RHOPS|nr:GCN5-related N-acetyltransferase [Rhodopseudomonas palustris BisB5]
MIVEQGAAIGRVVVAIERVEETSAGGPESDRSVACGQPIRALRLIDIALLPAAQGRCIGREVIAALAVAARSIEARRLTLSVQMSNDRAQSLYRRLGFIDMGGEAYRHMMMPLT